MMSRCDLILTTSPLSQPAKKPCVASLARRQRPLYGRKQHHHTVKERDSETGLYYYGARYLDSKTSRWLSGDPAMGEYVPSAPINDEARKRNGNLPGMGGVFNYVNLHVYHYAGNNPVRYVDPTGRDIDLKNDNLSNDEFEYVVKSVFNTVMDSDTEAGRMLREIYNDSSQNLTIKFGRGEQDGSYYSEGNGFIYIEMSDVGSEIFDHPGVTATLGTSIAHESGHAHADLYGYDKVGKTPLDTQGFRERIATAVENNYRAVNGLGQREVYHTFSSDDELLYFDVPTWNVKTDSWTLRGQEWRMPTR